MSVSVIVPVGRVDSDLPVQLEALANQTYEGHWDLVLSMNSPDASQTKELQRLLEASGLENYKIVDSSDVRSASHARNVGAAKADGALLVFCDGDDVADQDWLLQIVAALQTSSVVGGFLDEEVLAVAGQEDWRPPATPGANPTFLGFPFVVSANLGIARSSFDSVGGFDTTLTRGEDIALSWDLIERGEEIGYAKDAVMYYRHRKGLWPMMKQHYLYGIGFSEILARRGVPGSDSGSNSLSSLRPNSQAVAKKSMVYFLRRGSIAAGRIVGLIRERRPKQPQLR